MQIKSYSVGEMNTNCYLLWDEESQDCLLVDPGDEADFLAEEIVRLGLHPQAIVLTHGHYDHCLACLELKLSFNCPVFLHPKDDFLYKTAVRSASYWSKAKALRQPATTAMPSEISLGENILKVIPTPGHTPGSVCLYTKPYLFSGDTLFADGVGSTTASYSSTPDLHKSLKKLHQLPPETEIYPGHGESPVLLAEIDRETKF